MEKKECVFCKEDVTEISYSTFHNQLICPDCFDDLFKMSYAGVAYKELEKIGADIDVVMASKIKEIKKLNKPSNC